LLIIDFGSENTKLFSGMFYQSAKCRNGYVNGRVLRLFRKGKSGKNHKTSSNILPPDHNLFDKDIFTGFQNDYVNA